MNTSPFIHSTLGSCCLQSGGIPQHTAIQQTNLTKEHGADGCVSQTVRIRDQAALWLLGVLGIGTGCILWMIDSEGQWFVRGVSLASVAVGLLFWGILMHGVWVTGRPAHRSAGSPEEGFWFYSGGATHLGPVIGAMKQLADEVRARSVILLESQTAGWHFKAGYQASPGLGRAVAHALHQRVPGDGQTASVIEVLDAAVMAFCTPMSMLSGQTYALVALFEVASLHSHGSIAPVARRSAEGIREILLRVEERAASPLRGWSAEGGQCLMQLPVCCSICDQVRLKNRGVEHWMHWSHWLHQDHGLPLTHTVCPSCAGWLYDAPLHAEPDAKGHQHAA
jgi:hypothetical protein